MALANRWPSGGGGDPAQLVVDERKQFYSSFGIAVLNWVQHAGDVAGGMRSQYQAFVAYRIQKWTHQSL
jgi:hypothetical protein